MVTRSIFHIDNFVLLEDNIYAVRVQSGIEKYKAGTPIDNQALDIAAWYFDFCTAIQLCYSYIRLSFAI
jgi:hypothetical protein